MSDSTETPYVVSVKKAAGFSQYSHARLQVSVGGANHEGAKLAAMVAWMAARFEHVTICVNDTLQRHNLCFEKGLPDAMATSLTHGHGDQWIARHKAILDTLPHYRISRWEEWRSSADYAPLHRDICALYDTQPDMHTAINACVADFWERRCKRLGFTEDFKLPNFQRHSRAYLLEEMAVFTLMFRAGVAADVYPGSITLPFAIMEKHLPAAGPAGFGDKVFTHLSLVHKAGTKAAS